MTSARSLLRSVGGAQAMRSRQRGGRQRSFSSTSFGFASLEHEYSVVSHTPIFSQLVSKLMLTTPSGVGQRKLQILDMTFGSGGHTNLLLDHKNSDSVGRIVACDCDRAAYNEAKELKARRPDVQVVPLRSRFQNLPNLLLDNGFTPGCFDGILIDTGCSTHQWSDTARGFCPNKDAPLDLRYDPHPATPTGSEVLQNINDKDLARMLKAYSGMHPNMCRYVANSIVEARYLFHKFHTTDELRDVLTSAAVTYCNDVASRIDFKQRSRSNLSSGEEVIEEEILDEDKVSRQMMKATLTALQLCVNNDINELHFAINSVARNFLKPETGILVAIVNSSAESRVTQTSLTEADTSLTSEAGKRLDISAETGSRSWLPWRLVHGDPPQELTTAEKTLYPRLQHSKLYAASLVA